LDQTLTHWINSFAGQSSILDQMMVLATSAGVPVLVLLVVLQWWSGRGDRGPVRHSCVSAGLAFLAGLAANQLVLLFVHRVRPYDAGVSQLLIAPSTDWSFPSDHATASAAIVAAFVFTGQCRRALWLAVPAAVVCLSRIYVGTHYAGDILGGIATGTLAAFVVSRLYRPGSRLDRMLTAIL